jgi:hypothetical protein
MPSLGRQTSGMAATSASETGPGAGRVWHPADLPHGYHPGDPGTELPETTPITSRAAPGCRGRAPPGRRDATAPNVQERRPGRRGAVGRWKALRSREKQRERSSWSIPPCALPLAQVARWEADELAYKPDPVASEAHDQLRRVLTTISPGKPWSIGVAVTLAFRRSRPLTTRWAQSSKLGLAPTLPLQDHAVSHAVRRR